MTSTSSNFNGTVRVFQCERVAATNTEDVQKCILDAAKRNRPIHVIGNGYSFNNIGSENGSILLNLSQHMNRILNIDTCTFTVTVEAGVTIQNLCEELAKHNMALSNTPHFGGMTLGAAIATGIHGTCGKMCLDTFSSAIVELCIVDGRGMVSKLHALQSLTLGLYGVICTVTLNTVPLYMVSHRATLFTFPAAYILKEAHACSASTKHQQRVQKFNELQSAVLINNRVHDFVMYKYLLGNFTETCMKETFDIIIEPTAVVVGTSLLNTTPTSSSSSQHAAKCDTKSTTSADSLENIIEKCVSTSKTLVKYYFPAHPILTNGLWRNQTYVFLCERNQIARYYEAMMGPCTMSTHAEIEWAVPIASLPNVLSEIEDCVKAIRTQCDVENTITRDFWSQPVECHIRFSPSDIVPGHAAYHPRTKQRLFALEHKRIEYAWVNLNVRQHIEQAAHAFRCIEDIFMKHNGRPHWSKCWSSDARVWKYIKQIHRVYLHDLKQQCRYHDPQKLFHRHHFAETLLY